MKIQLNPNRHRAGFGAISGGLIAAFTATGVVSTGAIIAGAAAGVGIVSGAVGLGVTGYNLANGGGGGNTAPQSGQGPVQYTYTQQDLNNGNDPRFTASPAQATRRAQLIGQLKGAVPSASPTLTDPTDAPAVTSPGDTSHTLEYIGIGLTVISIGMMLMAHHHKNK